MSNINKITATTLLHTGDIVFGWRENGTEYRHVVNQSADFQNAAARQQMNDLLSGGFITGADHQKLTSDFNNFFCTLNWWQLITVVFCYLFAGKKKAKARMSRLEGKT